MAKPISKNFIKNRLNRQITSPMVRIINKDDYPEIISDKITTSSALNIAEKYEVDLIEIAVNEKENSSICKLMEKSKFLYQEKKKEKERKQNQKNAELKEIKLGVNIAQNDINTKLKNAHKFLEHGDNVKVTLQLRGRNAHMQVSKDKAMQTVLEFAESLGDVAKVANLPVWANNKLTMQLNSTVK